MGTWEEKRLGEIAPFKYGKSLVAEKRQYGKYKVFSSAGICGVSDSYLAEKGIIIGRKGSIGKVHYSKEPFYCIDTAFYIDVIDNNCNLKFIFYYLPLLQLDKLNTDAAVPGLNRNVAEKLKLKIPGLKTQEKIADILTSYDDLIENNNRRIAILEQTAQELYKEWFVRFRFPGHEQTSFENGIPKGWEVKRIGDICKTVGGGTPSTEKPEYWINGKIKWVTPSDLTRNDSIIFLDTEKRITELGLKKSSAKLLPKNTILMTSRASIGYFGLIDDNVCTNQGFISIIPNEFIYSYYLLYNLLERKEEIISRATGSTFKEISKSSFRKMKILYPSCELVEKFYQHVDIMLKKIKIIKEQNQNVIKQRDLLLPRLMSGKLEV